MTVPTPELIDDEIVEPGNDALLMHQLRSALDRSFREPWDEISCDMHEVTIATFGDQWLPNEVQITSHEFVRCDGLYCSACVVLQLIENRMHVVKDGQQERRVYKAKYRVVKVEDVA